MERNLFIFRHGKSSWDIEGLEDIYRPLSERGLKAAETMAHRLLDRGLVPELLFASPATRALNTALIMKHIWQLPPSSLQVHEAIYMASVEEMDRVVGEAPAEVRNLAVFGHNPTFTVYANQFLDTPLDNLPTAGVVVVTLDCDSWQDLGRRQVIRTLVETPKSRS
jgi:phosphohistidine phosphatase